MESFGEEEEEEVPEDIASLSPEKQEAAVKKKAFTMLGIGTFLVLLFSGKYLTFVLFCGRGKHAILNLVNSLLTILLCSHRSNGRCNARNCGED
jgi:hypothetical protein